MSDARFNGVAKLLAALHDGTPIEANGEKWRVVGVYAETGYAVVEHELLGLAINHEISLCGDPDADRLRATATINWEGDVVITSMEWGMR